VQHGHVALLAEDMAQVTTPTLVLCGLDDDLNGDPAILQRAIPNARLVRIPGDHNGALGVPEFREELDAWLDEVSPIDTQPM
jgi:pimeloyl-ACP methyl ester carboxylesterase